MRLNKGNKRGNERKDIWEGANNRSGNGRCRQKDKEEVK